MERAEPRERIAHNRFNEYADLAMGLAGGDCARAAVIMRTGLLDVAVIGRRATCPSKRRHGNKGRVPVTAGRRAACK